MNENNFHKEIEALKNINLTATEKQHIFTHVMATPIASPYASKQSWWNFSYTQFAYTAAVLVLFTVSGGMLAYADEGTVPGDFLYSIKKNITEPIHEILATTPQARAVWEATKATRRLDEAKALAGENKLTPEYQKELEQDFSDSEAAFHADVKVLSETVDEKGINDSFEKALKDRTDIIEKIGAHKNKDKQGIHNPEQNTENIIRMIKQKQDGHEDVSNEDSSSEKGTSTTRDNTTRTQEKPNGDN